MYLKLLIIILFSVVKTTIYSQSDFEKRWNNPNYEKYIKAADSAYNELSFEVANSYYTKAYQIRPSNYSFQLSSISEAILHKKEDLFSNIISIADSCIEAGNECDGQKLLLLLIKEKDNRIEKTLRKIHHPIHCNEIDHIYYSLIIKGDELFNTKEFDKAKLLYERALYFNKHEDYPKQQLIKIENK